MRYLAIDLGDKRTGLALGDPVTGIVSPIEVIETPLAANAGAQLLADIAKRIETHLGRAEAELVLGLPLNMDGSEGPQAKKIRAFGERLAATTTRTVRFHDERLTSVEADWSMSQSGMTHKQKKEKRDALAAASILRDYFASLRSPAGDAGSAGSGVGSEPSA
ncbi:MAG: Holliday junction resolvase RuvX [Phycisphaerales bacterium]|nr:Holliday junction resolvase RuvX [Phycisphaerales bacterium]